MPLPRVAANPHPACPREQRSSLPPTVSGERFGRYSLVDFVLSLSGDANLLSLLKRERLWRSGKFTRQSSTAIGSIVFFPRS